MSLLKKLPGPIIYSAATALLIAAIFLHVCKRQIKNIKKSAISAMEEVKDSLDSVKENAVAAFPAMIKRQAMEIVLQRDTVRSNKVEIKIIDGGVSVKAGEKEFLIGPCESFSATDSGGVFIAKRNIADFNLLRLRVCLIGKIPIVFRDASVAIGWSPLRYGNYFASVAVGKNFFGIGFERRIAWLPNAAFGSYVRINDGFSGFATINLKL